MRRRLTPIALAIALAGCGNERATPPDVVRADAPKGYKIMALEEHGVEFRAPFNWQDINPQGQMISGVRSKSAAVAVWRYPREERLPESKEALEQVKGQLEARVRQRDPTFELRESTITKRAGGDAIELVGRQTIAGLRYDVRSSHIFKEGAEVVIDAYARPEDFARIDASVFQPLLRSLKVTAP